MTTTLRYCENAATVARKFQEENEQKKTAEDTAVDIRKQRHRSEAEPVGAVMDYNSRRWSRIPVVECLIGYTRRHAVVNMSSTNLLLFAVVHYPENNRNRYRIFLRGFLH